MFADELEGTDVPDLVAIARSRIGRAAGEGSDPDCGPLLDPDRRLRAFAVWWSDLE